MDTNIQNIACLGKVMSICKKQHEAQFIKELSNTKAKLKKCVGYKKKRVTCEFIIMKFC